MSLNSNKITPQNLPEQIIWYLAIFIYPLYLIGSLYIVIPLIGAGLAIYVLWQKRVFISPAAWVWLAASLIILFAMIVGHVNFNLGLKLMVISTINNWYRRWALIPMFIMAGHIGIRPKLMYRAGCIMAVEMAGMAVLETILANLGVPKIDYISPLSVFGGGTDHYHIYLFTNAFEQRINAVAPWSTAAGTLGNFFFFLAWEEKLLKWRSAGLISALILIILSQSRAALLCIPFVLVVVWLFKNMFSFRVNLLSSLACFVLGIFSFQVGKIINFARQKFITFRGIDSVYSSRTRNVLYRMTIKSWWDEAPIWGHGRVPETGPLLTGKIPIGTHNTWLGSLYTFGLVGFLAFATASVFTLFNLIIQTQKSNTAKVGLSLFISMLVATFTDSLEFVNYVYWFASLFIGIALRQQQEAELHQKPVTFQDLAG